MIDITEEYPENKLHTYSIDELDLIVHNSHRFPDYHHKAQKFLELKLNEEATKNSNVVMEIDTIIRKQGWYDFHVWRYDRYSLILGGNYDLSYYHSLEITFSDVDFYSGYFYPWATDTSKSVIEFVDGKVTDKLKKQYQIQPYYHLFQLNSEDYKSPIFIAARHISYETNIEKMVRKPANST